MTKLIFVTCAILYSITPAHAGLVRVDANYGRTPAEIRPENLSPEDWHGSNHQDIIDAQRKLGLKPNGILGQETKFKIRKFQKDHSLPVTGWLDTSTMEMMDDPSAKNALPGAPKNPNTQSPPNAAKAKDTSENL